MKRRSSTSEALSLMTSSAAELKEIELMPIRRLSLMHKANMPDSNHGATRERIKERRNSSYSPHPRPTSARSRRRKSQFLRRPSSAKAFEAKTSFEFLSSKALSTLKEKPMESSEVLQPPPSNRHLLSSEDFLVSSSHLHNYFSSDYSEPASSSTHNDTQISVEVYKSLSPEIDNSVYSRNKFKNSDAKSKRNIAVESPTSSNSEQLVKPQTQDRDTFLVIDEGVSRKNLDRKSLGSRVSPNFDEARPRSSRSR